MSMHEKGLFLKLIGTNNSGKPVTEVCTLRSESMLNFRQVLGLVLGLTHYTIAGVTSGYSSVILAQLKGNETLQVTSNEASWIASIVVVPMAPASLLSGFLLSKMSRKSLLIVITVIEIVSWLVMYCSGSLQTLFIGRVLSGIASAMGSPIVPPYLAEISHPAMRGLSLGMVLLGLSLGLLFIHVIGASFMWQTCALVTAIILMAYFGLVLYLPETYAWYLRNGNLEDTKRAFRWYRGRSISAQEELDKFLNVQYDNISSKQSKMQMLRLCCSKLLLIPLGITIVGMVTMHLSGNKAIMFYSISILNQVIPSLNKYTSSIIVDVIRIFMTVIGCILIKKFRVRPLFIVSGITSAISHFTFSVCFFYAEADNTNHVYPILSLLALIGYTAFSSIGIAPLAWVIAGEIFPLSVKGIASGISCAVYFITFFIIVKITPNLFDALSITGGFLFFGVCTLLGTIVMYFILPETKNKTLKEIEDLFR